MNRRLERAESLQRHRMGPGRRHRCDGDRGGGARTDRARRRRLTHALISKEGRHAPARRRNNCRQRLIGSLASRSPNPVRRRVRLRSNQVARTSHQSARPSPSRDLQSMPESRVSGASSRACPALQESSAELLRGRSEESVPNDRRRAVRHGRRDRARRRFRSPASVRVTTLHGRRSRRTGLHPREVAALNARLRQLRDLQRNKLRCPIYRRSQTKLGACGIEGGTRYRASRSFSASHVVRGGRASLTHRLRTGYPQLDHRPLHMFCTASGRLR
jgi:hypothetical protein